MKLEKLIPILNPNFNHFVLGNYPTYLDPSLYISFLIIVLLILKYNFCFWYLAPPSSRRRFSIRQRRQQDFTSRSGGEYWIGRRKSWGIFHLLQLNLSCVIFCNCLGQKEIEGKWGTSLWKNQRSRKWIKQSFRSKLNGASLVNISSR